MVVLTISVAEDGTITGLAPALVPPGVHTVELGGTKAGLARTPAEKPFDAESFPTFDLGPWPEGMTLSREEIYGDGDDGR